MHPYLHIPAPVLGLLLGVLAVGWGWGWRTKTSDPEKQKLWVFAALPGLAALYFVFGGVATIRWPMYGLTMVSGCLFVLGLTTYWSYRRRLLTPEHVVELCLISGLCGLLGARAVHIVEQFEDYQDRPPAMGSPGLLQPLAKGDDLILRTAKGETTVLFAGDETTLAKVQERIEAQAGPVDVRVKIQTTQHRVDGGIKQTERGFLLKTGSRGPEAFVHVVGGKAVGKLGLIHDGIAKGVAIPLAAVVDLRRGGLTYFGSVFGVMLASFIYLRFRKVSYLRVLDVVAPTLPLGLFFGRLGCLSRGCCWGREAGEGALLSLQFPQWSPPWYQFARERLTCNLDRLLDVHKTLTPGMEARLGDVLEKTPPLHATQLYEGLAVFGVFWLVLGYRTWFAKKIGQTFLLLVLLQAPIRFVVEHMRRDHEVFFPLFGYHFTESQAVAVTMFLVTLPLFGFVTKKGEDTPPLPEPGAPWPEEEQSEEGTTESAEQSAENAENKAEPEAVTE